MYVEPLEFVDDSLIGKAPSRPKPEKKKGGLFSALFAPKSEPPEVERAKSSAASAPVSSSQLPDLPRDQIRMRCQECNELTGLDQHEGYCPNCGAFFVEPFDYVTADSLAAERESLLDDIEKYKQREKTFD
jgi:hypothetical protein